MQKNISKVTILQNPQSMNRKIRLQLHKISSDSNCILAIDQGVHLYVVFKLQPLVSRISDRQEAILKQNDTDTNDTQEASGG